MIRIVVCLFCFVCGFSSSSSSLCVDICCSYPHTQTNCVVFFLSLDDETKRKQIVRFEKRHPLFRVFSVSFHCLYRSFFSSPAFYSRQSYAAVLLFFFSRRFCFRLILFFLFLSFSVCVCWYVSFNRFLTHMRSMSVCVCRSFLIKLVHLYR